MDGSLLAVGMSPPSIMIVERSGTVAKRIGPITDTAQVGLEFTVDGKHLLRTGWFGTGLMTIDGKWVWKSDSRNLAASRDLKLFAGVSAPMHGPQYGDVTLLDNAGKILWQQHAWDAQMAVAPSGTFAAFRSTPESPNQPTVPPFPVAPVPADTPELSLRDRTGKLLAHREFSGILRGISSASSCILALAPKYQSSLASFAIVGLNRQLKEVWQISAEQASDWDLTSDYFLLAKGNSVSAYKLPSCS